MGQPRVLVVFRRGVTSFAEVAEALRRRSGWTVILRPLDPSLPVAVHRRELSQEKGQVLVALGPYAEEVAAKGLGETFWILALTSRYPAPSDRPGSWLAMGASPEAILGQLALITPGIRSLGAILRPGQDSLAADLRRVCQSRGVTLVTGTVGPNGDPLRTLVSVLRDGADAVWLGVSVEGWTAARLWAARRVQALLRRPLVGVTRGHADAGLLLSLDNAPAEVAEAIHRLMLARVPLLLGRPQGGLRSGGPGAALPRTAAHTILAADIPAGRVSVCLDAARSLGLDPRVLLKAGAMPVRR